MSTAALEVMIRQGQLEPQLRKLHETTIVFHQRLLDQLLRKVFRRRPVTDDMVQMLVDLGIEPQEKNYEAEGYTFRWSRL